MYTDYDEHRGLYRSRRGILFGVCRGLAEYFGFSVCATRILTLAALIFTGFFPVGLVYLILAFVMRKEPWCSPRYAYVTCDTMDLTPPRLCRTFDGLDKRIQHIEDVVTHRGYDFDERLDRA